MDKEIKNEEKPASEKQKKHFLSFLKDPHKRKLLIRWIIVILIVGLAVLTVVLNSSKSSERMKGATCAPAIMKYCFIDDFL